MADIQMRLGTDVLVVQGPMGTELARIGFDPDDCLPLLNIVEPEEIEQLHRRYRDAGADCAVTNTFLATSSRLAEYGLAGSAAQINIEGVRLARAAGFPHVLGCIGPCGIEVEASSGEAYARAGGDPDLLAQVTEKFPLFMAAVEQYAEQAAYLASADVDGILLETFASVDDAVAAVAGAGRETDVPLLACMTWPSVSAKPGEPAQSARLLELAGASAVGCNCMCIDDTVQCAAEMSGACGLPVIALPSAGVPVKGEDGEPSWPSGPDDFARASLDLLRAGARILGSCCGSTPACTGAIFATVGGTVFPE